MLFVVHMMHGYQSNDHTDVHSAQTIFLLYMDAGAKGKLFVIQRRSQQSVDEFYQLTISVIYLLLIFCCKLFSVINVQKFTLREFQFSYLYLCNITYCTYIAFLVYVYILVFIQYQLLTDCYNRCAISTLGHYPCFPQDNAIISNSRMI